MMATNPVTSAGVSFGDLIAELFKVIAGETMLMTYRRAAGPVSYTHLTLPTKRIV